MSYAGMEGSFDGYQGRDQDYQPKMNGLSIIGRCKTLVNIFVFWKVSPERVFPCQIVITIKPNYNLRLMTGLSESDFQSSKTNYRTKGTAETCDDGENKDLISV